MEQSISRICERTQAPLVLRKMPISGLQFVENAPPLVPGRIHDLDQRMQTMLAALKPRSDAEALKMLRANFPQSTLAERLRALSRRQRP